MLTNEKKTRRRRSERSLTRTVPLMFRTSDSVRDGLDHFGAIEKRSRSSMAEILLTEALTARGFNLQSTADSESH